MGRAGATHNFLAGGGECGALIRAKDWSKTPLGPPETWPQSLKTAVRIILTSRQPMFVWWGKQLINLYNDPYRDIVGGKHPEAIGQPASVVWHEIWDQVGPRAKKAMSNNVGTYDEALLLIMERHGYPEETYYTFSYSPIPGESGKAEGIICANTDDTNGIVGERQLTTLKEMAAQVGNARDGAEACRLGAKALWANNYDIPFAMIYLANHEQKRLELFGTTGISQRHTAAPKIVSATDSQPWPFFKVLESRQPELIEDLDKRFAKLPTGAWDRPPHQAIVMPITRSGSKAVAGLLVVALNPFRVYQGDYEGFIKLLAGELSAGIANAEAYENERKRAEALTELDRAKTNFFSNVSHEFRTPLTLILGPLEDILRHPQHPKPSPETAAQLDVAYRNGLRLQKLVNTLLDFSRIEAGRVQALYIPTDLAELTTDLASNFRSAVDKAGMKLRVDIKPLDGPVYVDREMWEKIVLNLLSNAFKYTLKGSITVRLSAPASTKSKHIELQVIDTGTGIKAEDLPKLFDRFHRVQGAASRTHEGTGIGLALVQELVKLHGGSIKVDSSFGKGTTFTITIPKGYKHLPTEHVAHEEMPVTTLLDEQFVQEALRWLPQPGTADVTGGTTNLDSLRQSGSADQTEKAHIVLADDNADMRDYVGRLLQPYYEVTAVNNGRLALEAISKRRPDVVLTDVMMPHLDGFGLLKALRQNPDTSAIPVIMLSARAGEEAHIEGLDAGADDYLVKPFAARELLARVSAHLEMARTRKEAASRVSIERQRLYDLFMHAPASIAVLSGKDLVFELANPDYRKLLGVKRDVVGRPLLEVIPDIEPSLLATVKRVAFKGERFTANELPIVLDWEGDGTSFTKYFNLVYEPIFDADKQPAGMMAFANDISEQVAARNEIADQEAYYREMTDNTPVMTWVTDTTANCTYLNRQWYDYTGQKPEEALGIGWLAATHPDDAKRSAEVFLKANSKQQPFSLEYRLRNKDGSYHWMVDSGLPKFDDDGQFQGYVGSVVDIHKRKQVEMQLRDSEEQLRFMAESMPQKIFTVTPTGQLSYFNQQWEGYTGIKVEELLRSRKLRDGIIHPDDVTGARKLWRDRFMKGRLIEYEYRLRNKDGNYRWHISRVMPMKDQSGAITIWIGSNTDIDDMRSATERRHELEIKTAKLTEQRTQLMALNQAKDEFISLASHQLRTPATGVKQYLGMLLQGFAGSITDEQKAFIETAYESNERQITIVNDLLRVARIDAGKVVLQLKKADVVRVVKSVLNEHASKFNDRNQKIVLKVPDSPVLARIDADRIRMVFDNIIDNAIKYTANDKTITVRVEAKQTGVIVAITDQGVGMDKKDTGKIFQKFSRLEDPSAQGVEGSGLGLYWAKKIIDLHEGRITVRSTPGKGTTFTVSLPQ